MLGDIVFAVASAPGAAPRGIVRVSGSGAFDLLEPLVGVDDIATRGVYDGTVEVVGFPVEALVISMPGPGSYTGEDVVELHLPGSPLLLARVGDRLREAGARDATPGEFTRRAFEHGRLDLAQAEAVGELIHAESEDARRRAVGVLEGGISSAVDRVRSRSQDALAMLEAGLDFEDEDSIGAISVDEWLPLLERAREELRELSVEVPKGTAAGSVLVVGAANAGKSSLCNALVDAAANSDRALVSSIAGTTRDVLSFSLRAGDGGPAVTLLDAPGDLGELAPDSADARALRLRDSVALPRTAAALWVLDARDRRTEPPRLVAGEHGLPLLARVVTHIDLADAARPMSMPESTRGAGVSVPEFRVSCTVGTGIAELRAFLLDASRVPTTAPSGANARIAAHAASAAAALDRALVDGRTGHPVEVVALSVGEALASLDAIVGRSEPDQLLDRIFARFCLGK